MWMYDVTPLIIDYDRWVGYFPNLVLLGSFAKALSLSQCRACAWLNIIPNSLPPESTHPSMVEQAPQKSAGN